MELGVHLMGKPCPRGHAPLLVGLAAARLPAESRVPTSESQSRVASISGESAVPAWRRYRCGPGRRRPGRGPVPGDDDGQYRGADRDRPWVACKRVLSARILDSWARRLRWSASVRARTLFLKLDAVYRGKYRPVSTTGDPRLKPTFGSEITLKITFGAEFPLFDG